jgi:hypothetical protein
MAPRPIHSNDARGRPAGRTTAISEFFGQFDAIVAQCAGGERRRVENRALSARPYVASLQREMHEPRPVLATMRRRGLAALEDQS